MFAVKILVEVFIMLKKLLKMLKEVNLILSLVMHKTSPVQRGYASYFSFSVKYVSLNTKLLTDVLYFTSFL